MYSRTIDLLYAGLLTAVMFSGSGLIVFAFIDLFSRLTRAMSCFLTCWEFDRAGDLGRELLTRDAPLWDALTMTSSMERTFLPLVPHGRQLRRLRDYRLQKAQALRADMIWDRRLGALLTPDEYLLLYGKEPMIPHESF